MNKHSRTQIWIISILIFCLTSLNIRAEDSPSFEGDWSGLIKITEENEARIRIKIEGSNFTQFFESDGEWAAVNPAKSYFESFQDSAMAGWINSSGIWTESQTFSLSYVNAEKLNVVWNRHVTNREEGKDGEPWNMRGEGELLPHKIDEEETSSSAENAKTLSEEDEELFMDYAEQYARISGFLYYYLKYNPSESNVDELQSTAQKFKMACIWLLRSIPRINNQSIEVAEEQCMAWMDEGIVELGEATFRGRAVFDALIKSNFEKMEALKIPESEKVRKWVNTLITFD